MFSGEFRTDHSEIACFSGGPGHIALKRRALQDATLDEAAAAKGEVALHSDIACFRANSGLTSLKSRVLGRIQD